MTIANPIKPIVKVIKQWYYADEINSLLDIMEQKINFLLENEKEFKSNRNLSIQDIKEYFERVKRYYNEYVDVINLIKRHTLTTEQFQRFHKLEKSILHLMAKEH